MKLQKKLPLVVASVLVRVLVAGLLGIHQLNRAVGTFSTELRGHTQNERQADEMALAFKTQVQESETVADASGEIASGNLDLSRRTEAQAAALEETASSMEELTSTAQQTADNAKQANQLAHGASQLAIQSGDGVELIQTLRGIDESSKKIADIIGVIDGIAFQTHILALNAAVEAAKEIKNLIGTGVERVEPGSSLVGQAGTPMTEVVSSIKRVTDIVAKISSASSEQSLGVAQIDQAITATDQAAEPVSTVATFRLRAQR